MQSIWLIVIVLGPVLLIAALVWATLKNKHDSSPAKDAMTERATKQAREAEAAEPKDVDGPLG